MVTRLATWAVEHGSMYGFFGDCCPRSQDKNSQIHKCTHSQGVGVCYKRYKLVMSNIFLRPKGPWDQETKGKILSTAVRDFARSLGLSVTEVSQSPRSLSPLGLSVPLVSRSPQSQCHKITRGGVCVISVTKCDRVEIDRALGCIAGEMDKSTPCWKKVDKSA